MALFKNINSSSFNNKNSSFQIIVIITIKETVELLKVKVLTNY